MPRTGVEFRVRWRRDGRGGGSRIFQTEPGARHFIDRMLALEEIKHETDRFRNLPDFAEAPTLQARLVGDWNEVPEQVSKATPHQRQSTREWAGVSEPVPPPRREWNIDPADDELADVPF